MVRMEFFWGVLGEWVCCIQVCLDVFDLDEILIIESSDEVHPNVYVFSPLTDTLVLDEVDCPSVVFEQDCWEHCPGE